MALAWVAEAQPKRPSATVTPSVARAEVSPGGEAVLDLHVTLPARVHVQAHKLTDPFFIPTVLTVDSGKGATVADIQYPPSERLKQAGLEEPLVVFGSDFNIKARIKIAADAPAGDLTIPGRLRYQACDETTCYPPARAEATWTVHVGAKRN